jgi:hypothetical protein
MKCDTKVTGASFTAENQMGYRRLTKTPKILSSIISWNSHVKCFLGHELHHTDRFPEEGIHNEHQNKLMISEGKSEGNHYIKQSKLL